MSAKEESKFGFKDKAKALETIKLLEEHDLQYRKLTVRGLLGRAKRVLSMTKAEDKLKNINEAIKIFENWLEENGGGASNKNTKTNTDEKIETVPGLGFKDKDAAEKTLKILKDRDPEYQKLAIKGLIGSSKRVLSGTKNEDKIKCIKEGVKILEDFLEKFERDNLIRLNRSYLSYDIIKKLPKPNNKSGDDLVIEFLDVYNIKAKGNYKHLRTLYPKSDDSTSWDIIRNRKLQKLHKQLKENDLKLFKESGEPTEIHLNMIHWAYSPQPDKLKAFVENVKSKVEKRKTSSSSASSSSDDGVSSSKKFKK